MRFGAKLMGLGPGWVEAERREHEVADVEPVHPLGPSAGLSVRAVKMVEPMVVPPESPAEETEPGPLRGSLASRLDER